MTQRRVALALAFVPPILIAWFIFRYAVDMPYADEWMLVPYLNGEKGLVDVAAFHNEHRLLFPRLILIGLARLTGWNTRVELIVAFSIGVGTLIVLWRRLRRDDFSAWALPLISALIFTYAMFDIWLLGWNIQSTLSILAVIGGLVIASGERMTPPLFAGVAALGVLAQFSFANGILFWPLTAAVAFASHRRWQAPLGLLLIGAISSALFLWGWNVAHPNPEAWAGWRPVPMTVYMLVYLGQPLLPGGITDANGSWQIIGAGVLAAVGLIALVLVGRKSFGDDGLRRRTLFALALAVYAVTSAALTAVPRHGLGNCQAASPRYIAISTLLWIPLIALAGRLRGWKWILVPIALGVIAVQVPSRERGIALATALAKQRDELVAGVPTAHLAFGIPPADTARWRESVKALRLSCFR